MSKFKKGDIVRYLGGSCGIPVGTKCMIDSNDDTVPNYHTLEGEKHVCAEKEDNFELATIYKVGDILSNPSETRKVLAYLNQGVEVYLLSNSHGYDAASGWFTLSEMEQDELKLVGDNEVVEKTVAELEQELKLSSGTLRIKKEN